MNDLFDFERPAAGYSTVLLVTDTPLPAHHHSFALTRFGMACIAENPEGVCAISFGEDRLSAAKMILNRFPNVGLAGDPGLWAQRALRILENPFAREELRLTVHGTAFQKQVWHKLLETRFGSLTTYGAIAASLGLRKGARAVGTAVAANPLAFFIPCHRVVNSDGESGHFRWGAERKKQMIAWERATAVDAASAT